MRRRTRLVALLAAVGVVLPLAPAAATDGPDPCDRLTWWEDAQRLYLRYAPQDPYGFDQDGDGIACESLPRGGSVLVPGYWLTPTTDFTHDWDGDGTGDLLAIDAAGRMRLYPGSGIGTFLRSRQVGTGWGAFDAVSLAGDLTGDGHGDVLAVRESDGTMWLYPGNGRGALGSGVRLGGGWGAVDSVTAVGDLDKNGTNDLVAVAGGVMSFYPGNGAGGFGVARRLGSGWGGAASITGVGDIGRDGHPDLVAVFDGELRMLHGNGRGTFRPGAHPIGNGWTGFRLVR